MTIRVWRQIDGGQFLDEAAIRAAHPLTVFPLPFTPQPELYEPVHDTDPPEHDPLTHDLVWSDPAQVDGQWQRTARTVAVPPAEAAARQTAARKARVPAAVTRAQGKLALARAGLWDKALQFVASIDDPEQKIVAEVAINDTLEWRRESPFLALAAQALGLDDVQLDELFIAASAIEI